MRPFHLLMRLLYNTQDALHTRQHAYGVVLWNATLERRVRVIGDGKKKVTSGVSFGLHFLLSLRAARNSQNVNARPRAMDDASVSS